MFEGRAREQAVRERARIALEQSTPRDRSQIRVVPTPRAYLVTAARVLERLRQEEIAAAAPGPTKPALSLVD
jgi:hypothetical protein